MAKSDKSFLMTSGEPNDRTIMTNKDPKLMRNRFFTFLPIVLVVTAVGSAVSGLNLVYDIMDGSDAGLTAGEGTATLGFLAPILVLIQVFSAIILFFMRRMALRSDSQAPGRPGRPRQLGRMVGLIFLVAGLALTFAILVSQISIDAYQHAIVFVSLRALEVFCLIGFVAVAIGIFGRSRR